MHVRMDNNMFGRKKEQPVNAGKVKTTKTVAAAKPNKNISEEPKKKKHPWILKTCVILLVLGLLTYGGYSYLKYKEGQAYIKGGEDAIQMVVDAVKENGGVTIEYQGEAVTASAYYKPIGQEIVDDPESEDTTEASETSDESSEENTDDTST